MEVYTPMQPAKNIAPTPAVKAAMVKSLQAVNPNLSDQDIERMLKDALNAETWKNGIYTAQVRRDILFPGGPGPMIHLTIKRNDKAACRDWRHFQRIKNEVLGPEIEAVEMYPAESRLVDTANQYHLWALTPMDPNPDAPAPRFPWGYTDREVVDSSSDEVRDDNSRQRPIDSEEDPAQFVRAGQMLDDQLTQGTLRRDTVSDRYVMGRNDLVYVHSTRTVCFIQYDEAGNDLFITRSKQGVDRPVFDQVCERASEFSVRQMQEIVAGLGA